MAQTLPERLAEELARKEEDAASLRKRMAQFAAREQLAENRRETAKRKAAERKKYVAGGAVLAAVQAGHIPEAALKAWVDAWSQRPKDRALFGLD
jgi:hypothetical protein